jgi:hypothetical protein
MFRGVIMRNLLSFGTALALLVSAVLGCSRFGSDADLFQDGNAVMAATAIKKKIGASKIGVIRAEVRKNSMKITIQSPNNPKNIDEYTFEKGRASGPEPVQAMSFGTNEMTADKYHLTDIDQIDFAAIPETVRQAIARSELENGSVDVISMESQYAEVTNPELKRQREQKAEELKQAAEAKTNECFKPGAPANCMSEASQLRKQHTDLMMGKGERQWDLAWRIFVEAPRGRKDFIADKQGRIIDNPYR